MAAISREQIMHLLEEVNYPGFSRNIVSFGMVGDIDIQDSTVHIQLRISSSDDEKKNRIKELVRNKIESQGEVDTVSVSIVEPGQESGKSRQPNESGSQRAGQFDRGDPWADQHRIPGVTYTVAVASGKGGVGKSTVAANLAAGLKQHEYNVGLLDLDIYGPSLPTLFGIKEQPYLTKDERIAPLEKFGIKLMSFGNILGDDSPVIWRGPMVAKMVDQFLNGIAWGELDYLILDLPPGTGDVQLTLVQKIAITGAVMVTTPQQLALQDVKRGADMFRKVNSRVLGIIENMSYFTCPHCGEPTEVFSRGGGQKESIRLGVPLLGRIPLEPAVMETSDLGEPVVFSRADSEAAQGFLKVAGKLAEQLQAVVE